MKKLLLTICTILCANVLLAQTEFLEGQLYYEPTSTNEVSVSGYYDINPPTNLVIPQTVTHGGTDYTVTSIGNNAFVSCTSLTSVDIPNSVTSIGQNAFASCTSLTSVSIPNSVISIGSKAFNNVFHIVYNGTATGNPWGAIHMNGYIENDLVYSSSNKETLNCYIGTAANVTIPEGVTTIGGKAFQNRSNLISVTIPNSCTSIGDYAFHKCSNLTSVTIGNSVTSIGQNAFQDCSNLTSVNIPDPVTSIGQNAFSGCERLNSVTIPNSVTSIGQNAFSGCERLNSVTIPNSVTSIGQNAFIDIKHIVYNGTATGSPWGAIHMNGYIENDLVYSSSNKETLNCYIGTAANVTIPESVTTIGKKAFYFCNNLISITIPEGVTTIKESAFCNCKNLESATISNTVTSIEGAAFSGCANLVSVNIPNGVTSIEGAVFSGCANLTSITIPNGVTSIGQNAFGGCERLSSITIPNGVTSIGGDAFWGCKISSITIPNSITSIEAGAFSRCSQLTTVTIGTLDGIEESNSVNIMASAFRFCDNLRSVEYYTKAPALGTNVFQGSDDEITLTIPFLDEGDAAGVYTYTNLENAINWKKIKYIIPKGKTKTLTSDFTIKNAADEQQIELENNGVLVVAHGKQLINETEYNNLGIVEVETASLPSNQWSFIGAPFEDYKLEVIKPDQHDISISEFDYTKGEWSSRWATILTEVGAGEGLFAWSFEEAPTTFTTYGDVYNYGDNHNGFVPGNTNSYDFDVNPIYKINNDDVTVTKTVGANNNGNWMALANPYTFKLDIATFLANQQNVQGGVSYRFDNDDNTWQTVTTGTIDVTEGFFVNFASNNDPQTATFKKSQRYIPTPTPAKASAAREFVRLAMLEGEIETEVLFAQNDEATENYDIFDANKLFSPNEIAEPYFVTNNIALAKEEVNTLPYYATMNVKSYGNKEVTFKANYIPEGLAVSIIDGEETIDLGEGVEYTTNIIAGENADRFKVLIKKSLSISDAEELDVNIYNDNRHINIETLENDLQVEVYNALGQKVLSTKDRNFTLNQVSAGAYLIKAFNNKASKTQKIVLE